MQDYYWVYLRLQRSADFVCTQIRDGSIDAGKYGSEIIRRITYETAECEKLIQEGSNVALSIYKELCERLVASLVEIADYAEESNVEYVGELLNLSCTLAGFSVAMSSEEFERTRITLKAALLSENTHQPSKNRESNIIYLSDYIQESENNP